jgi:amino acid transporter
VEDILIDPAVAPHLKADVIGPWGLAALVIGVTSPAIGLYATWGPIEATAGPVAPLVFLAALVITLPTVLSYASLTRHAPSAGAAPTWLWTTVNPTTGLIALSATVLWVKAGQTGGINIGPFNPIHATQGLSGFWAANAWVLTLSATPDRVAEYNSEGLTAITPIGVEATA